MLIRPFFFYVVVVLVVVAKLPTEIQEMSNAWEGRGEGVRDGHVCIYFSNKEQSLYRILTLFMISSLDELSFSFYNNKNCVISPSTSSLVTTLE